MRRTIILSPNNFNRNIHLELLTTNNELRPSLENIFFEDGNAIMTDSYFLVIAPIKEISTLNDDTIKKLEGQCIHKSHFKTLLKCDLITDITENHIIALNNKIELHIPFADHPDRFPDYHVLFPIKETDFNIEHKICFSIKRLALICKVFHQETPILTFHGDMSPFEVNFKGSFIKALIAPAIIDKD